MGATSPEDRSNTRALLQAELDRLTSQLRAMEESVQKAMKAEGNRPGFGKRVGDYTSEAVDATNNRALAKNMGRSMEEIRRALEKVEEGTYGACDLCGKPIPSERLEVLPWANLCIECKRKKEQRRY